MANLGGGLGGAATGASIGSSFGPIGTGVGAVVGGIAGLFGSKKKKRKPKPVSRFDPNQQKLNEDYIASLRGEGPFKDLYNYDTEQANQVFDQSTGRPAYRSFEENVIPRITGQFRGNNIQNSSYAGQSLARAGRDVQENLDALRSSQNFAGQQNAQQNRRLGIQDILNRQTFDYQSPEQRSPSTIDQILGSLAPSTGDYLSNLFKDKSQPAGISGGNGSVRGPSGISGGSGSVRGATGSLGGSIASAFTSLYGGG